jgi:TldD protein
MRSWLEFADQYRSGVGSDPTTSTMSFKRQLHVLATTEGTYCTQTLYETEGAFGIVVGPTDWRDRGEARVRAKGLGAAGKGWEMFLDAQLRDQTPRMVALGDELRRLPTKHAELGRFDLVLDGGTMASLLDGTIGTASQLDRAFGYEANDNGTSYLAPPLDMVGTFQAASPLVTILANRSAPTQLATVKWDDDGVEPDDFTLIKNGVLVDYQTTRESASWLAPYYQKQGLSVRSHGCAWADSAMSLTMQHTPNLVLVPESAPVGLDDMIANIKRGLIVLQGHTSMDFQASNGTGPGDGYVREIRNGKLGAIMHNAEFVFTSLDVWKNVVTLGGVSTVEAIPATSGKGQPGQTTAHTVSAPAAIVRDVTIVDPERRG